MLENTGVGMVERRRHPRFKPKEGAVALHAGNLGRINNISLGGISCSCAFLEATACGKNSSLDLFYSAGGNSLHLHDLPVTTVSSSFNLGSGLSCFFTRRCGIKFRELSESQAGLLNKFISLCRGPSDPAP